VARPPDRQGVVARVAWAAVVVVGLLMTLIATAAMANTDAAGRTKTFHDYPDDRLPSLTWAGTAQPTPDVGFVYDTNQLATLSIGTEAPATLTWDRLGNLSADATRTFAWDGENRLVGVTYLAGTYNATSFTYDGLGRRTSISLTPRGGGAPVTTRYVWCGDELCQGRNAAGAVTRAYYAEGESVSGSPARPLYDAPDHLGSVRRVFGKNQASAFDYDAYGNLLQSPTTVVTDFTWAGMFNEPNSGLYLTNYRPYDPVTGRFITRDPAGETADPEGNLYPYAANDPVNSIDPLGLAGDPATATHIAYLGVDAETGKPYVGYASMQGARDPEAVLKYRYGGNFDRYGGTQPAIVYSGYGQGGKDIARGLEQRIFKESGGLEGTANHRNPVGKDNPSSTRYQEAADEHLNKAGHSTSCEP
jgi:RHS repeat-associated protein